MAKLSFGTCVMISAEMKHPADRNRRGIYSAVDGDRSPSWFDGLVLRTQYFTGTYNPCGSHKLLVGEGGSVVPCRDLREEAPRLLGVAEDFTNHPWRSVSSPQGLGEAREDTTRFTGCQLLPLFAAVSPLRRIGSYPVGEYDFVELAAVPDERARLEAQLRRPTSRLHPDGAALPPTGWVQRDCGRKPQLNLTDGLSASRYRRHITPSSIKCCSMNLKFIITYAFSIYKFVAAEESNPCQQITRTKRKAPRINSGTFLSGIS